MVEVRNNKTGISTTIKESSWKNWGSAKAKDNSERHGYVLVRTFEVDHKGNEVASIPGPMARPRTFQPPSVQQGQSKGAEDAAQKELPEQAAPPVQQKPQGKPDHLAAIPALGIKVQEALAASGISTYKELAAADPEAIGKVLDGMTPSMGAKRAQIPAWQKAAAGFVKQAETPMQ